MPAPLRAADEFRGRKLLIAAAAVGLSTGMTATMFYSLGTLMPALQASMGWSRGQISLSVTIMTVGLFLAGPLVGTLCDRLGAATVGSLSLLGYGCCQSNANRSPQDASGSLKTAA